MDTPQIVIDTNVFISALRSKNGASYALIVRIGKKVFECNISVPLLFEYEKIARDPSQELPFTKDEITRILNFICANSNHHKIFYLWRPYLKDQKDDMVLELALSSNSKYIVTFNRKDFVGIENFGIQAITPKDFLNIIGELS